MVNCEVVLRPPQLQFYGFLVDLRIIPIQKTVTDRILAQFLFGQNTQ